MAKAKAKLRPSEVDTKSFSVRIPRELKARIYAISAQSTRGWYSDPVTKFIEKLVAHQERRLGIQPPQ